MAQNVDTVGKKVLITQDKNSYLPCLINILNPALPALSQCNDCGYAGELNSVPMRKRKNSGFTVRVWQTVLVMGKIKVS